MKTALKFFGAVLICALVVGIVYEQLGRWQDRKRLPQIGRSVDIGGRTLNIFCSGDGSPAVIFESPGAGPGSHGNRSKLKSPNSQERVGTIAQAKDGAIQVLIHEPARRI